MRSLVVKFTSSPTRMPVSPRMRTISLSRSVALGHGDVFKCLDLVTAQHLKETLARLGELGFPLYRLALGLSPGQEDVDRPQVAADRVSTQLGALVVVL